VYYYQEMLSCLQYMKYLENNKMFLYAYHEELITGRTPLLIEIFPNLELRYYKFKQQYLMELATSKYLLEQQYYLNYINTRKLTKILRNKGTMRGKITSDISNIDKIVNEIKEYKPKNLVRNGIYKKTICRR